MDGRDRTPIYHFTHAQNLPGILEAGCLHCKALIPSGSQKVDISLNNVQRKRQDRRVGCEPGGTVHDYVPFHFAPRSPMMFRASRRSNVTPLIHIVSSVERVVAADREFVFSDGHPVVAISRFYNDVVDLNRVDWRVMRLRYWKDTEEEADRERRRQAEFLVHRSFPWDAVAYLAVRNKAMKVRLEKYLTEKWPDHAKPVTVELD